MANVQSNESVRKQYNEKFDISAYFASYYDQVYPNEKTCTDKLYDIFESGRLKGPMKRCLEVGCGPVVYRMAPVSRVCDAIVYSDFSDLNKKMVKEWLTHEEPMPHHYNLFKYCAEKEGFRDIDEGIREIENRIKSKVLDVIHVDLRKPQPVGKVSELFDVVITSGCVECACLTYESYVSALEGIADVLRLGGYIIIRGYIDGDYYYVGEDIYPCLNLTLSSVSDALIKAGFRILEGTEDITGEVHSYFKSTEKELTNLKSTIFMLAQKT